MAKGTKVDIKRMLAKLQAAPDALGDELGKLVKQEAKGFVKDVVDMTPPASQGVKGNAAKKQGERRIEKDLGVVFSGVRLKGERVIPHLFGDYSPEEVKNKPPYVVPEQEKHPNLEPIYAMAKRKAKKGRHVALMRKGGVFVDERKLRRLEVQQKRKVGGLAGGYNAAAARLGVQLPAWVKRHGNRFGRVQVRLTRSAWSVTIINRVPYGPEQHMQRIADYALAIRRNKLERRLPYVLRAAIRKAKLK